MAKLILGLGTSHSPLLGMDGADWEARSRRELEWESVNRIDGTFVSYQQLRAEIGDKYADIAVTPHFIEQANAAQRALDRLGDEIAAAKPDVVIIIGDDHAELFERANFPMVSIYQGEELVNRLEETAASAPQWQRDVQAAYGSDSVRRYPGAPAFAADLIERMVEQEVDLAVSSAPRDPRKAGIGHAYGFVIERLFRGRSIPVVPILLNTYFPPNVPTPARAYKIGQAIRKAIEESTADLRVAIVASGGLSHFLCEEKLDRSVMEALQNHDGATLSALPRKALISGSSEILNWVMVGGAVEGMKNRWAEYLPVYRTPAGTGIGLAFTAWS
jgi:predicted class III extradiol MEMO1 family dioxygenase